MLLSVHSITLPWYTAMISSDVYSDYTVMSDLSTFIHRTTTRSHWSMLGYHSQIHQRALVFLTNKMRDETINIWIENDLRRCFELPYNNWHHLKAMLFPPSHTVVKMVNYEQRKINNTQAYYSVLKRPHLLVCVCVHAESVHVPAPVCTWCSSCEKVT